MNSNQRTKITTKVKLCKHCSSKKFQLRDCVWQMKCRIDDCGREHHTLLHIGYSHKASVYSNINHQMFISSNIYTFLQLLPIKVSKGLCTTQVNYVLDPDPDTM